jgi:hypothetical protein
MAQAGRMKDSDAHSDTPTDTDALTDAHAETHSDLFTGTPIGTPIGTTIGTPGGRLHDRNARRDVDTEHWLATGMDTDTGTDTDTGGSKCHSRKRVGYREGDEIGTGGGEVGRVAEDGEAERLGGQTSKTLPFSPSSGAKASPITPAVNKDVGMPGYVESLPPPPSHPTPTPAQGYVNLLCPAPLFPDAAAPQPS